MKLHHWVTGLMFVCMMLPPGAFAANSVLSGVFDGSEPKLQPLPGTCGGPDSLAYKQAGEFQVSASGAYTVIDALNYNGLDVSALIYNGSFNPASPFSNLVTPFGVDTWESVDLTAGVNYILVIQQWCTDRGRFWVYREGAWAIDFTGPGEVTSNLKVSLPVMTYGSFAANDPTAITDCGDSHYRESGPVQVTRSGTYYYTDLSIEYAIDMCLQIYTAPFDPANPAANRIMMIDDFGSVDLQAGQNYYFVAQVYSSSFEQEGEFFYLLAPPAPFGISYAMAGSWYFPDTTGQGFLIDVFDSANLMFLAWFTYDLERPANGVNALIGDPGHRWITALGPFQGNTANLNISWSSGMIFDSELPKVQNNVDGTMTVEFFDCYTGRVSYDLGSSGRTGEVPIERIVNDAVPFCESMAQGPGKPGPL